jgi:hypothetical protein
MVERSAPLTPEGEAALHRMEAKHRRRHRWLALFCSVVVSVHMTLVLHTLWEDWPLDTRDLSTLILLVVNALSGVGFLAGSLRCLRTNEALERQRTLDQVRWQAERRAWPHHRQARRGPPEDAATR